MTVTISTETEDHVREEAGKLEITINFFMNFQHGSIKKSQNLEER